MRSAAPTPTLVDHFKDAAAVFVLLSFWYNTTFMVACYLFPLGGEL